MNPVARLVSLVAVLLLLMVAGVTVATILLLRLTDVADTNKRNGEYVVECTTPGAAPPPITGHPCFDAAQARTATAVLAITDANANGVPDLSEIAAALGVALPPPPPAPPPCGPAPAHCP